MAWTTAGVAGRGCHLRQFHRLGLVVLALAGIRPQSASATPVQRHALWFGFWSFIAAIVFLGFLSLIYDFHNCVYPSREQPYFWSGRLMLGALIPFVMLYVYGLDRALGRAKNRRLRPLVLAGIILFMLVSEMATDWPVFSSPTTGFTCKARGMALGHEDIHRDGLQNILNVAKYLYQFQNDNFQSFTVLPCAGSKIQWSWAASKHSCAATVMFLLTSLPSALASLPPGWSDADIGSPGLAGSASYANGVWTVTGGGSDIWNSRPVQFCQHQFQRRRHHDCPSDQPAKQRSRFRLGQGRTHVPQ